MTESIPSVKRVAFVSNNAWSVYNYRIEVIRHLLQQGYEIFVITPDDECSGLLVREGCRFIPISFNNKSENPLSDIGFFLKLRTLYRIHRPHFIFHFVAKPNIYGTLAAASNGIPSVAVITGLGYAFARRNWLYWVVRVLYQYALKKAREVWFLNNEDARIFIDQGVVPIEKVKVLPGEGVDTGYFSKARLPIPPVQGPRFTFLMSARLLQSKGIGLYADAARILKKKNYEVVCSLIGLFEKEHPDAISPEDLARWQAEGLIRYDGFERDVRPNLAQADCFVFPSFYNEGVPRSLMEAASMELPVITSNTKGCREVVIENETGFRCNSQDPFDLADKMEKMMQLSPSQRDIMGKKGREWVIQKFDVQKVIAEYADTLDRAWEKADKI